MLISLKKGQSDQANLIKIKSD